MRNNFNGMHAALWPSVPPRVILAGQTNRRVGSLFTLQNPCGPLPFRTYIQNTARIPRLRNILTNR